MFADPAIRAAYARACGIASGAGQPLHLRLAIEVGAPELHALRWELLRDPEDATPVSLSSQVFFSRYLASSDWRAVSSRARGALRALAVVAAPADLARFSPGGVPRAATTLATITTTVLAGPGQATLTALVDALREGVDIFYLVAHGALHQGTPRLWLEAADGSACVTHADALVT
ncbi:MAG: CHAT domain-containing protein [Chloroflexales bacterium]|nr:CHAT domain-containing protein [Chloroflexales bacterium]